MWRWPYLISGHFPFSSVLSFIAMAMVIVFFVTSAGSGQWLWILWHQVEWQNTRLAANILGLAHGHCCNCASPCRRLSALQTVTIASALPFSVILLISIYGLLKALRRDLTKRESLSMATIALRLHVTQFLGREGYAISRICRSDLL